MYKRCRYSAPVPFLYWHPGIGRLCPPWPQPPRYDAEVLVGPTSERAINMAQLSHRAPQTLMLSRLIRVKVSSPSG